MDNHPTLDEIKALIARMSDNDSLDAPTMDPRPVRRQRQAHAPTR